MRISRFIALAGSAALLATAGPAWAGTGSRPSPAVTPINNLARTPYMGWNTYYGLGSTFNEQTIKDEADALVSRGLAAAGYNYVWIDGGWWSGTRDASGNITADPTQWPDGMKAVADYIHSRGLKAGIYTDSGLNGCGGANQGSYGRYQQDVNQFAAWDYDAVKVDFCGSEQMKLDPATVYGQFRDAVLNNSSHRPMLFNICNPFIPETGAAPGRSAYDSYKFGPSTGNSWRTDTDIGFPNDVRYSDMLRNLDADAAHPEAAGPGHWNDPDYLAPDLGLTDAEAQSQFSMWSMVAAPLVVGSDVRKLSTNAIAMLTNREVLAVDQDPLGIQGTVLPGTSTPADTQVWTKPLAGGDVAVALMNRGTTPQTISTTAAKAGLPNAGAYALRDLWQHTTTESAGAVSATVAPHAVVLLRVSRHGDPSTMAPSTVLSPASLTPSAQASLPLAAPGDSFPVSATFTDNGRVPVSNVKLTLTVPAGWTVTPISAPSAPHLGSGQSIAAKWQVTVAAGTLPGPAQLALNATYAWRSSNYGRQSTQTVSTSESTRVQSPPRRLRAPVT